MSVTCNLGLLNRTMLLENGGKKNGYAQKPKKKTCILGVAAAPAETSREVDVCAKFLPVLIVAIGIRIRAIVNIVSIGLVISPVGEPAIWAVFGQVFQNPVYFRI